MVDRRHSTNIREDEDRPNYYFHQLWTTLFHLCSLFFLQFPSTRALLSTFHSVYSPHVYRFQWCFLDNPLKRTSLVGFFKDHHLLQVFSSHQSKPSCLTFLIIKIRKDQLQRPCWVLIYAYIEDLKSNYTLTNHARIMKGNSERFFLRYRRNNADISTRVSIVSTTTYYWRVCYTTGFAFRKYISVILTNGSDFVLWLIYVSSYPKIYITAQNVNLQLRR